MSKHAPFAPSSADRWSTCLGSFGLSLQMPEEAPSSYADEGTRLHDVAASMLVPPAEAPLLKLEDTLFLQPYVAHCAALMERAAWYDVEETLPYSALLYGTPDFVAVVRNADDTRWLHVVDLKTGQGIPVDPEENKQLMTYAGMVISRMPHAALACVNEVVLTIVQPPDEDRPVKSWSTTVKRIAEWMLEADAAIEAALQGSRELTPGEHCRWCKAKPVCPKLRGLALTATALPMDMQPTELATWLDHADVLQKWLDSLRELGHTVASSGVTVPGWMLKPKRATRTWADEDAVLEIARRRKIKIWQDKLLSPAMAEKAHPDMPQELKAQIVAISSGFNLVRGDAPVKAPVLEANPMGQLMANFELLKYRK